MKSVNNYVHNVKKYILR